MATVLNIKKAHQHIIDWMTLYMKKSGQKIWVIGVSGGVDSAVVSTLCAETGYPVLCLEIPIHQDESHVSRAEKHIEWLQKKYDKVSKIRLDLTETFNMFESVFAETHNDLQMDFSNDKINLALANTRSRMRMVTLYYYSNILNGLVAGTGNKVEDFGVGFFSIGGDQVVDISPIADLLKTEVWQLAEHLGINKEIINASPSDGLWGDTRSDESQIGAAYSELEWAMDYIENNREQKTTDREEEVLAIYRQRHAANLHKMVPIPICDVSKLRN